VDVIEREAARVLLIDRRERILLMRGVDPADPDRGSWWLTPGGGLDPGESHHEAARRELREETGIDIEIPPAPVWERTTEFPFDGLRYRQHELFFLVRLDVDVELSTASWTELERRAMHEHRWWALDDIATCSDAVYPEALRANVRSLLVDGVPSAPLSVL
jgi:8-oxo-dGTP pyrophosphatase MutT (NUDIX family)